MTTLRELLNIEIPLIQAPMAGVQGAALAVAVCNAGALGSLPCAMLTPETMRQELLRLTAQTPRPYNVNFFCHAPPEPDAQREAAWRETLAPYPDDLVIVTKIGARRGEDGSWLPAASPEELRQAVYDNLRNLQLDVLDVVNMRFWGDNGHDPAEGSVEPALAVLAELQREGLIRHIGLSNVTPRQVEEALGICEIVCVQNQYNLAHRADDALIDTLAARAIAYVPFFPLGGFSPLQSETLSRVARQLEATPMQVALAWLLQRSPNILLIPGTSSLAHLRENVAAAAVELPDEAIAALDGIGAMPLPA